MKEKYCSCEELPLSLRVEDLMHILGIGRNSAYALVQTGRIRSIKIGRQLRIPKDALIAFLEGNKGK
jgi:excisionase family DNA binding protein